MIGYFEDAEVGETADCGSVTVTKEEAVEFAERYDPQPFHVDEEAAAGSIFGGLIASGWHTAALCMRLVSDVIDDRTFAGGRGVDDLRWHRPLRPGTALSVEVEVAGKDSSGGPSGTGYVDFEMRGYDEDGQLLISLTSLGMLHKRAAGQSGD
jgi:acyl dehydratase